MLTTRGQVLGAGALGAAVSGLVYGVEEFVLAALAVAALMVAGSLMATSRRLAFRRHARLVTAVPDAEISAGQSADAEVTVVNIGRRRLAPVLVAVDDANWTLSHPGLALGALAAGRRAIERTESPRPARGFAEPSDRRTRRQRARDRHAVSAARRVPGLGPGSDAVVRVGIPSARRGVLTLSRVHAWCLDPFGLTARQVGVAPPAHVIVYPAPATVTGARPASGSHPGRRPLHSGAVATQGLAGDELSGLRPYAPGDRLTRLHWPSLARAGDLLVRDFVEPDAGMLALLVDLRPTAHTEDTFERTIAHVAGVGADALARGVPVELCTSAGDRVAIPPDAAGRQTLMRALALLGPAAPPPGTARRWAGAGTPGAVWAASAASAAGAVPTVVPPWAAGGEHGRHGAPVTGGDVIFVTTAAGTQQDALPAALRPQADTVVIE